MSARTQVYAGGYLEPGTAPRCPLLGRLLTDWPAGFDPEAGGGERLLSGRPTTPFTCRRGWFGASRISRPQLRHRGQRVGIARQEPSAVGLFAVYRDTMTGELRPFSGDARGHR
jgi:hypothetical protein